MTLRGYFWHCDYRFFVVYEIFDLIRDCTPFTLHKVKKEMNVKRTTKRKKNTMT